MLLLLVLKTQQIQTGANWDSVITMSVSFLLLAGILVLLGLVGSRIKQRRRVKRAHQRSRRKAAAVKGK